VSLLAIAGLTALGAALGRLVYGRLSASPPPKETAASVVAAAALPKAKVDGFPTELFAAKPGDVVLRGNEEAWLAGAWILEEGRGRDARAVFAVFFAPEAGKDVLVVLSGDSSKEILWLDLPVPMDGVPPSTLEIDDIRFERLRKRPFGVRRFGAAPEAPEEGTLVEFSGPVGERLWAFVAPGHTRAWRGVSLAEGMYDLLGGDAAAS
jgi:hypothetical protein